MGSHVDGPYAAFGDNTSTTSTNSNSSGHGSGTLSSAEKKENEKKKEKQQMWKWLSALEGNISLPGFAEAFMNDNVCVTLLLKALGVDPESGSSSSNSSSSSSSSSNDGGRNNTPSNAALKELLDDPLGSQVSALTALFQKCQNDKNENITKIATTDSSTDSSTTTTTPGMYLTCIRSGVIDRLLLRIGELQAEEPRDPTWTEKYEDPIVVNARKVAADERKKKKRKKES